jgi:hypothetical protein
MMNKYIIKIIIQYIDFPLICNEELKDKIKYLTKLEWHIYDKVFYHTKLKLKLKLNFKSIYIYEKGYWRYSIRG